MFGLKKQKKRNASFFCDLNSFNEMCGEGYVRLDKCPEIMSAVNKISDLISSMTIHLIENTENGDQRIENGLSKILDISPNPNMTRKSFISNIVRIMMLEGGGNAVVIPKTSKGFLKELIPVPPGSVGFNFVRDEYTIFINGVPHSSKDVLHFVLNPDPTFPYKGQGYTTTLPQIAKSIDVVSKTKRGFMESKWKPSIIIKVDGLTDEFSNKEGRKKLLESYISSTEAGEPWMIPADQFEVIPVKPLSLNDLAVSDAVKLDKRTVAAILDVPPFVVGEGAFNEEEWNNFISTKIKGICNALEQEFTRKLLVSPNLYYKFNLRSLFSYDIVKLSTVGSELYTRGIMTGNEVRDWVNLSTKDNLDELIILENYIPKSKIGDQSKLKEGGE